MNLLLAAIIFTLTPDTQFGAKSNTIFFAGTLNNTGSLAIFLNDMQITATGLTGNTNAFFANVPGILAPSGTYSDIVFAVTGSVAGDYSGTVTITGGTNIFDTTTLASESFQVTITETPFGAWQWQQFGTTNSSIAGDLADPDADTSANALEYALGLDPNTPDAGGLPFGEGDPSCDCLTLVYTKAHAATDVSYRIEGADDPGGAWTTNGITETIIDADTLTMTIRARDAGNPFTVTGKRFLRLKVTQSP